MNTNRRKKTF